jgi:hypothetical protein
LKAGHKQHLAILAAQEYDSVFVFVVFASHIAFASLKNPVL